MKKEKNDEKCFILDDANLFKNGFVVVKLGDFYLEINKKGECVTKSKEEFCRDDNNNEINSRENSKKSEYHYFKNKNGMYGLVDTNNVIIIPFIYKSINRIGKETLLAKQENGKYIIINFKNEKVSETEFSNVIPIACNSSHKIIDGIDYDDYNLFPAIIDEKWGFIDAYGNVKIDFKYSAVSWFNQGLCQVSFDCKHFGFINKRDELIIPFEYDSCTSFEILDEEKIFLRKNSKWGIIDFNNNVIADFIYDTVTNFSEGYSAVLKNGKWGFIDSNGKALNLERLLDIAGVK